MTREQALRCMLAGRKVEHSELPRYFFAYDAKLAHPIIMCRKSDGAIISETAGSVLPARTGWKEYKVKK